MNRDEARRLLAAYLADQASYATDATEYRGTRADGAWVFGWDSDVAGEVPEGHPYYVVLDEDGSVHAVTAWEPVEDALGRIRSGT